MSAYTPFPLDSLPAVMRPFVEEGSAAIDVDRCLIAGPALAIAGASIGNAARAYAGGTWSEPALLWIAMVTLSGSGKSPSLKYAAESTWTAQSAKWKEFRAAIKEHGDAVKTWKANKKEGDEPSPPPPMEHLVITDATVEAIGVRLADSPRGVIGIHDELPGLFKGFNKYKTGGGDVEAYLSFYDAGAVKIDRKMATPPVIVIDHAFVAIAGGIQPGALRRAMTDEVFDNGMAARFLFCAPPDRPVKWTERGVSEKTRAQWAATLDRLRGLPLPERPRLVPMSNAAKAVFRAYLAENEAEAAGCGDERWRACLAKLRGVALRLGLILQFVAWADGEPGADDSEIDERTMLGAVAIARWFKGQAARVYGVMNESDEDRERRELLKWIAGRGGRVSARDMQRNLRQYQRDSGTAELDLQRLVDEGYGNWETVKADRGGPPVQVFCMADHPDFPRQECRRRHNPR